MLQKGVASEHRLGRCLPKERLLWSSRVAPFQSLDAAASRWVRDDMSRYYTTHGPRGQSGRPRARVGRNRGPIAACTLDEGVDEKGSLVKRGVHVERAQV